MALPPVCNKNVTNSRYPSVLAASLAAILWAAPLTASATALQFALDTSSLSGSVYLTFDFIDGDGLEDNNTAVISGFSTDGTLGNDTIEDGDVSGALSPGPLTLRDTVFSSFLQPLTFGNTLSFTLTLTQQRAGGTFPDSFAFFLLNPDTFLPLFETTDPTGAGALFAVDIDGSPDGIFYTFEPVAAVPLPSTAWLLGAGLLGGLMARRRRTSPLS